jgi:hypothetical protein
VILCHPPAVSLPEDSPNFSPPETGPPAESVARWTPGTVLMVLLSGVYLFFGIIRLVQHDLPTDDLETKEWNEHPGADQGGISRGIAHSGDEGDGAGRNRRV